MHDTIIVNVQGLSTYTPQSHSPQIYTHCEAAGQDDKGTAQPLYGIHTQQEYQTGDIGSAVSLCSWVPVPAEPSATAGTSRHRDAQVSYGHLCKWLFLART